MRSLKDMKKCLKLPHLFFVFCKEAARMERAWSLKKAVFV